MEDHLNPGRSCPHYKFSDQHHLGLMHSIGSFLQLSSFYITPGFDALAVSQFGVSSTCLSPISKLPVDLRCQGEDKNTPHIRGVDGGILIPIRITGTCCWKRAPNRKVSRATSVKISAVRVLSFLGTSNFLSFT